MKLLTYLQKTHTISRRDFADMLKEEVIFRNDTKVTSFDEQIAVGDSITIHLPDGDQRTETVEKLPTGPSKIILFHKPRGYVVSKDDKHNKTIYELMPKSRLKDFRYVGRLDKDSTGLLLLTNDSRLVDRYENPVNDIHKVYQIQIDKPFKTKDKIKAKQGLWVDQDGNIVAEGTPNAELLKCVTISYFRDKKEKYRLTMTLNEGKKRHIRRLLKALGYKVHKLHRIKVGKRHIGTLKPGKWRIEKIKRWK